MLRKDHVEKETKHSLSEAASKCQMLKNFFTTGKTQTKNYAIGLSVDENDVDMQSQNSDLFSSEDMEEENESDDDIEYWLNDVLEKINMTSDSSENECKCRIFSNKHLCTYLKFLKVRGVLNVLKIGRLFKFRKIPIKKKRNSYQMGLFHALFYCFLAKILSMPF